LKLSFELFFAARYLRARRRQAVIGLVTAISIFGIAAGVAALILALAITNGMRRDVQDRLLGSSAHIDLLRADAKGIRDWQPLVERLGRLPHVVADAPGLYEQVLVARGPRDGGALLKGILPTAEDRISHLEQTVTPTGAFAQLAPEADQDQTHSNAAAGPLPPIILGSDLAETIGAAVGDSVMVISPQGELTPLGIVPKYVRFRLAGIFHSGFYQYDSGMGYIRLADAQRLFAEPDLITVIDFRVDDLYAADRIARTVEQAAGPGFQATSWMEENRELFRALALQRVVTFLILGLIVLVAALNILIALTMMVMEKTRDIAILMSFGVEPAQIRRIFLLQGLLISLLGTALGLVLGYLGAWAGSHYHFIRLSASLYNLDTLPFAPRLADGVLVGLVSIGVALTATLYPSAAAARILPAEALRYE
jgi:lipoprotein-releasing system permease protein